MSNRITLNNRYTYLPKDKNTFLGQGGMGSVYQGTDTTTNQPIAIKLLKPELIGREDDVLKRFELEGEALRQLNHPNIVKMLDAVEDENGHYLIMEYVSGGSLRDVLDETPRFSIQRTLYVALDVADALTRAHRLNILHRDIKPANVLLAADGTPRLTDFGMARIAGEPAITQDGAIVGTMAYLAPEAFHSETPDERTDIWAFGVMLYEMLAGERPFPQHNPAQLINAILTHPTPDLEAMRPDVPTALVDLIYRMITKDRTARIPSVRLIGAEIEAMIRQAGDSDTIQPVVLPDDDSGRFNLSTTNVPISSVSANKERVPNNLPNQPTPFVGREQELDGIAAAFNDGANMVTLIGAGGMGKTRIAIAYAEQQLSNYNDGVFFVPLAPLETTDHLIAAIAESLNFNFASVDTRAELLEFLREKELLLILDNFEHMTDSVGIVSDIMSTAQNVHIIVTSRERLRLRGEQIYEVDGMILPDRRDETPESLMTYPAAQLFMQSAHRVMPSFEVENDDIAHDVAQIIRLVGGLPLGIELAAAWLEMLPINEIVTEIENSLDFLETDLRDVPERHRSVRAVFEYSWNLLTEDEQLIFKKLSVFRGGFEREAAQKVTGATLRNLTALVNKSLLSRDAHGRYNTQKLLRQYAEERIRDDADLKIETYTAHAEYYAAFIGKLASAYNTPRENDAVEVIDKELENIRMMWHNVINYGNGKKVDMLREGIETMHFYHIARSTFREAQEHFEELIDHLTEHGRDNDDLYWSTRIRQAWIATRMGDYDFALKYATGGYEHFSQCGNCVEVAHALNQMSYVHMMRGNYEASIRYAQMSLDNIETEQHDTVAWFMGMGNMGYAYYLAGNLRKAREIYEEINARGDEIGYSPTGVGYGKNNLGEILRDMGETSRSLALFKEAYALFEKTHQRRGMAFTMNNIGGVLFLRGEYDDAKSHYERAYELNRDIGDKWGTAHSLSALGNIGDAMGNYDHAETKYKEALRLRREMGNRRGVADSLTDLTRNSLNRNQPDAALAYVNEALEVRRELGDAYGESDALISRAMISFLTDGIDEQAKADVLRSLDIGRELEAPYVLLQSSIGMAEVAASEGDYDEALQWYQEVLDHAGVFDEMPIPVQLMVVLGVANIHYQRGNDVRALELVSLVLRYPRNFMGMVAQRAANLMEKLKGRNDEELVTSTISVGQQLVLQEVIEELFVNA